MEAHTVVRRRGSHIFLQESRLTDGDEVVSLTRRLPFTHHQPDSWYFW
jgi:hypothetical protein